MKQFERYQRQVAIPEIGEAGQKRIEKTKVLLIGAGGLGSSSAFYLAAAGIGVIGIADGDTLEISNLNRQILHDPSRIGMSKAISAKQTLERFNPSIDIITYPKRFTTTDSLARIVEDYDLVIDCSDNFPTRFTINAACIQTHKPWVYGAVSGFEGQAMMFVPGKGPCYRCLYRTAPPPLGEDQLPGVIGVSPGVIGIIQASVALKYILGESKSLVGRIYFLDLFELSLSEFRVQRNPNCQSCGRNNN